MGFSKFGLFTEINDFNIFYFIKVVLVIIIKITLSCPRTGINDGPTSTTNPINAPQFFIFIFCLFRFLRNYKLNQKGFVNPKSGPAPLMIITTTTMFILLFYFIAYEYCNISVFTVSVISHVCYTSNYFLQT